MYPVNFETARAEELLTQVSQFQLALSNARPLLVLIASEKLAWIWNSVPSQIQIRTPKRIVPNLETHQLQGHRLGTVHLHNHPSMHGLNALSLIVTKNTSISAVSNIIKKLIDEQQMIHQPNFTNLMQT